MDDPRSAGRRLASNPDGVVAVTVVCLLGALYAFGAGVWNLGTDGTPEGVALVLAAYLAVGILVGFWRGTLWGYVGLFGFLAASLLVFWAFGEALAAGVAAGVLGYLTAVPERYLSEPAGPAASGAE